MAKVTGYDIKAIRKACEEMEPYQRSDCPICGWPLEVSIDGILHCRFDGWVDQSYFKRNIDG